MCGYQSVWEELPTNLTSRPATVKMKIAKLTAPVLLPVPLLSQTCLAGPLAPLFGFGWGVLFMAIDNTLLGIGVSLTTGFVVNSSLGITGAMVSQDKKNEKKKQEEEKQISSSKSRSEATRASEVSSANAYYASAIASAEAEAEAAASGPLDPAGVVYTFSAVKRGADSQGPTPTSKPARQLEMERLALGDGHAGNEKRQASGTSTFRPPGALTGVPQYNFDMCFNDMVAQLQAGTPLSMSQIPNTNSKYIWQGCGG